MTTTTSPSIFPRRHRVFAVLAMTLLSIAANGALAAEHAEPAHTSPHAAMDDAHLRHVIEFVMARIDEPQRERVGQLAHAALGDLDALQKKAENVRAPRATLLLADTIDRAALERARVAELKIADERSRRVDRLLIDVAGALTPPQRAQLRTEMAD